MNSIQAKNIAIQDYLLSQGIKSIKKIGNELVYYSPYRNERTPSFNVNVDKNTWYDHGTGEGGNILDLVMKIHNINDFSQALAHLEGRTIPKQPDSFSFSQQDTILSGVANVEVLPITKPTLISYIQSRGIDIELARLYCKELHYHIKDNSYYSIGFKNDMGGWELNSPIPFKGCISPKHVTTFQNNKNTCLVFEGFFDFLSYLKLKNIQEVQHDAVVLNSTANLKKVIDFIKSHDEVFTFLDNDESGRKATEQLKSVCKSLSDQSTHYAKFNDLNDYLQHKIKSQAPAKKQSKGRKP